MSERRVASRYSKSLLSLAQEKGLLEEVNNDMELLASAFRDNRDLTMVIKNPIIPNDKKLNILKALFEGKVSELTFRFFEIISRKNRENLLPDIAASFRELYNDYKGIIVAQVITSFPLDSKLREDFKKVVKHEFGQEKTVELVEKIDASLIGGYTLTVGDKRIDQTLDTQLRKLKMEFGQKHKTFVKGI